MRFLAFIAAVAVVVAQPLVTLAAPPGGVPVYRPAAPPHRPAQALGERSSAGVPFRVPFAVHSGPKPLPDSTIHSAFETSQRVDPQTTFNPFRWRGIGWVPALLQPACYATSQLWSPSAFTGPAGASMPPTQFTVGSLVDGHANLSSPSSYAESMAAPSKRLTASGPLSFQYGFQPAPCGGQLLQSL